MYSFDDWGSFFASDLKHVKSIVRDIHKKARIRRRKLFRDGVIVTANGEIK